MRMFLRHLGAILLSLVSLSALACDDAAPQALTPHILRDNLRQARVALREAEATLVQQAAVLRKLRETESATDFASQQRWIALDAEIAHTLELHQRVEIALLDTDRTAEHLRQQHDLPTLLPRIAAHRKEAQTLADEVQALLQP